MSGDLASALEALAAHANVNSLDASGYTRMPKSSDRDRVGLVETHNRGFASAHPPSVNITLALHQAVMRRDARFIAFLLANGADPNIPARDGRTALHLATLVRHNRCV